MEDATDARVQAGGVGGGGGRVEGECTQRRGEVLHNETIAAAQPPPARTRRTLFIHAPKCTRYASTV